MSETQDSQQEPASLLEQSNYVLVTLKVKTNGTDKVVKVLKENLEFYEDDLSDPKQGSKEVQHEVLGTEETDFVHEHLFQKRKR